MFVAGCILCLTQGFVVNVTLRLYAVTAVSAAAVSTVGSWPNAKPVTRTVALKSGINSVTLSIAANQTQGVHLWHPHGHGEQPLYNISATVSLLGAATTARIAEPGVTATRRIGFRHTALVTINDTNATEIADAADKQNTGSFTMMFRVSPFE